MRAKQMLEPDIGALIAEIRVVVENARKQAAMSVNSIQIVTNYEIGRKIVAQEQHGASRSEYGKKTLAELSRKLTAEFGKGFSKRNLELMRRFYLDYREEFGEIAQTLSAQSGKLLSWSHYVFLMAVKDRSCRGFYAVEALKNNWSLTELNRQFDSALYERLALSRDKEGIRALAEKGQVIAKPQDVLKNPYVLEFLGLEERHGYSENELEGAIIDKLEQFLLELGKGFLFEARQKRFTFDEDHFFVDLVFYNRLLRCYVLIDLKIGKLTHQDLGQMQMYVNYFDRQVKTPEENNTVGIILCRRNREALVEITLPKDANIHAAEYSLYLPDKELLKARLLEWAAAQEMPEEA